MILNNVTTLSPRMEANGILKGVFKLDFDTFPFGRCDKNRAINLNIK